MTGPSMHKRKLDPRLYDDEWAELERKARWSVFVYFGIVIAVTALLVYVVGAY